MAESQYGADHSLTWGAHLAPYWSHMELEELPLQVHMVQNCAHAELTLTVVAIPAAIMVYF